MERNKITVALLGLLSLIAVGVVLKQAQSVILPLIVAWLLSYILAPVINFLARRKVPVPLAVTLVLVLLLWAGYLTAIFLHARIAAFVSAYPKYHAGFMELLQNATRRVPSSSDLLSGMDWENQVGSFLGNLAGSLVAFTSKLITVVIFLVFLLFGKPYFSYKIREAFSPRYAGQISTVLGSISRQIGRYLTTQFFISLATGVLVWLALTLIGVQFAVTWGTLAFLLNFIPTVGSIIASIPPILVALVQFYPNYWPGVATLISVLTIQMMIGNVIAPKLMGDRLNLSPVVVLLSLLFWGWLWGIVGALLSVPIASAIKIVCENVDELKPISVMMGSGKIYYRDAQRDGRVK